MTDIMVTVLLIGDSRFLGDTSQSALMTAGFDILTAEDGAEGVRMANASVPDVILLDLMMPSDDGLSVLRDLKSSSRTQKIPILILSSNEGDDDIITALASGATGFIPKNALSVANLVIELQQLMRPAGYLVLARRSREWLAHVNPYRYAG